MLKKIYHELVLIRRELQAIRSDLELRKNMTIDSKAVSQAIRDSTEEVLEKYRSSSQR